jgi:hypothetical protein
MFTCPASIKSFFALALSELPDDRKIYQFSRLNGTSLDYEVKLYYQATQNAYVDDQYQQQITIHHEQIYDSHPTRQTTLGKLTVATILSSSEGCH